MNVIGTPDPIWDLVFDGTLIPKILALVLEAWTKFQAPPPDSYEVPITKALLPILKDLKLAQRLPVQIAREAIEDDREVVDTDPSGEGDDGDEELEEDDKEEGRLDLVFRPTHTAREEVYLSFECKRLNAKQSDGSIRPHAGAYVSQGMMRYVRGRYAHRMRDGGMIGYVLDGNLGTAQKGVNDNIRRKRKKLRLVTPPDQMKASCHLRDDPRVQETEHDLQGRRFRIHHVFLTCKRAAPVPPTKPGTA